MNIVYRNYDRYGIKQLLKEIGEHRLNTECRNQRLPKPTRLSLFYLESDAICTFLVYKFMYGSRKIMKIDSFEMPEAGWIRVSIR